MSALLEQGAGRYSGGRRNRGPYRAPRTGPGRVRKSGSSRAALAATPSSRCRRRRAACRSSGPARRHGQSWGRASRRFLHRATPPSGRQTGSSRLGGDTHPWSSVPFAVRSAALAVLWDLASSVHLVASTTVPFVPNQLPTFFTLLTAAEPMQLRS